MPKKLLIPLITLLIIFISLAIFFFLRKKDTNQNGQSEEVSSSVKKLQTKTAQTLQTRGGTVNLANIYKNKVEEQEDGTIVFQKNEHAIMSYSPTKKEFYISILSADFETARKIAEKDFLNFLNATEEQACGMNVYLYALHPDNKDLFYKNFGLSFCY